MRKAAYTVLLVLLLSAVCPASWAATQEASFTQQDRDRLNRLEVLIEEGFKNLNKRIDDGAASTNKRIDDTNKRIDDGVASTNKRIDDTKLQISTMSTQFNVMLGLIGTIFISIVGVSALIYSY
ncbi:MAG: hypothetical protein HQK99_15545 [Nitrospirae bacterium]|nr:hypothetical protein [Nitrospirota bacterium]